MGSERAPVFRFGVFEVDASARELRRHGVRIHLQVQPFQVLMLLLERAGEVVTRDELRQALWPSSVFVDFDHGLNNAIARVREALGDAASTPHFIETLPRLGYRFIYPLGNQPLINPVAETGESTVALPAAVVEPAVPKRRIAWPIVSTLGLLAAVIALVALFGAREAPEIPTVADRDPVLTAPTGPPSIAVLPFVGADTSADSEHLAAGLSAEIINALTAIRGLKVVGRSSAFYLEEKQDTPQAIARVLNVQHVLTGSVRRSGERLQVTTQLLDADDGSERWSQTFDRDLNDIIQIQEEIAVAVAGALSVKLVDADAQRVHKRETADAEAYRLYVIANAYLRGISVKRDLDTAKAGYEAAIARDPQFAAAFAGLARYRFMRAWALMDDVEDSAVLGRAAAERAVALDPESSDALQARANFAMWRYRFRGDLQAFADAHRDYRRAIQLDPANDDALFDYGRAVLWHEPELAQSLFERLVELEPLARPAWGMSAMALSHRGEFEVARARMRELNNPADRESAGPIAVYSAALDLYVGNLADAAVSTRRAGTRRGLELRLWLWSVYMSLGDTDAARATLDFGVTPLARALSHAAGLAMDGRNSEAFESLDSLLGEFPQSRALDLPAARLALIAGKADRALAIVSARVPDLAAGVEPINAQNVMPALDLAAALSATDDTERSRPLLTRIATFLDGPAVPRLPLFVFLRARTHALAGESELAATTLDRAYDAGFRTTWAPDLHPQPILYVDSIEVDPAFAPQSIAPQYARWLVRIKDSNAQQLAQLRSRDEALAEAPRHHPETVR